MGQGLYVPPDLIVIIRGGGAVSRILVVIHINLYQIKLNIELSLSQFTAHLFPPSYLPK